MRSICLSIFMFLFVGGFSIAQENPAEIYSSGVSLYKAGDYEAAAEKFGIILETIDEPKVQKQSFINRGLSYDALQKYDLAIADFTEAIKLDSTDMASFIDRGLSRMKSGALEAAKEDYNYVIWKNTNPRMRQNAIYWLARISYQQANFEETIKYCDQYLQSNSKDAELHFIRGTANDMLRNYEQSIEDYSKAIELSPEYYQAYANRGTAKINVLTGSGNLSPKKRETKSACKDLKKAKSLGDTAVDDLLFVYCND